MKNRGENTALIRLVFFLCMPLALIANAQETGLSYPVPSAHESAWIGDRIFRNECNRRVDCLTAWNEGEDFPSLGIGHFIWYRAGQEAVFEESFPALLTYLESQTVQIPEWLPAVDYKNPWPDRAAFIADFEGPRLASLRQLLARTVTEQTTFIVARFESALDLMLRAGDAAERETIAANFLEVANSAPPHGLYALIDYVNFKGEGVSALERYQDQGWGLRQVLLGMDSSKPPLDAFVESAKTVLSKRVANAPADRGEERWLAGWFNRLDTYLPPTVPEITGDLSE